MRNDLTVQRAPSVGKAEGGVYGCGSASASRKYVALSSNLHTLQYSRNQYLAVADIGVDQKVELVALRNKHILGFDDGTSLWILRWRSCWRYSYALYKDIFAASLTMN